MNVLPRCSRLHAMQLTASRAGTWRTHKASEPSHRGGFPFSASVVVFEAIQTADTKDHENEFSARPLAGNRIGVFRTVCKRCVCVPHRTALSTRRRQCRHHL